MRSSRVTCKLSARFVDTIKKPGKYGDGDGLWLCVSDGGRKTWVFRWMRARKSHERGLGSFDLVPLAVAREKAREARIIVRKEGDAKLPVKSTVKPTFRECSEDYLEGRKLSEKRRRRIGQLLRDYVHPVQVDVVRTFGDVPVDQIDALMVQIVLDKIWKSKALTAGEVRSVIEMVLDFAAGRRHRQGENPARWKGNLKHVYQKPTQIQKRGHFRSLHFARCPALAHDLADCPDISAVLAAFDLRTVLRAGNARYSEWDWVDWKQNILNVPAELMKAQENIDYPNNVYQVPLSTGAMIILKHQLERRTNHLIFPGTKRQMPMSAGTIYRLMKRLGYDTTTHGFRSSLTTWADNRTICELEVKEMALGHGLGDKTREAYSRSDWFEKRRHLMQAWDDFLATGNDDLVFIGISDPNLLAGLLQQISKKLGQFVPA